MKKIISALAALFCLAALLCGCSGGGTESSTAAESTSIPVPEPESSAPESIEPEPESSEPEPAVLVGEIIPAVAETTVSHGSETAFTAQVLPENAADKTLLWESDDESVATVDKGGVVTAVSQGKCRITVRSADGGAVSDIALTVGAPGLTYIQGILVVNKTYSLPADYDPGVERALPRRISEYNLCLRRGLIAFLRAGGGCRLPASYPGKGVNLQNGQMLSLPAPLRSGPRNGKGLLRV